MTLYKDYSNKILKYTINQELILGHTRNTIMFLMIILGIIHNSDINKHQAFLDNQAKINMLILINYTM